MTTHPVDFWRFLGRQLGQPEGRTGRLIGRLMDFANARPLQEAITALNAPAGADILDIGFGSGRGVEAVLANCPECSVSGIDRSRDMVASAMRRNATAVAMGRVDLRHGSAAMLPWAQATFDRVLAINVAYFFTAGGREMNEVQRVLRPGGLAVVYVTSRDSMKDWPFASSATHRTYDETDLRALMHEAGFGKVELQKLDLQLGVVGLIAVGTKSD